MKLTDPIVKAAKPKDKPYSIPDGQGLVLYVQPSGAKWWRYRYRYTGKAKMLSLGVYPDVPLKDARKEHAYAKELLAQGIDPSLNRQEQKQREAIAKENSFEAVARQWWDNWKPAKSERHAHYVVNQHAKFTTYQHPKVSSL